MLKRILIFFIVFNGIFTLIRSDDNSTIRNYMDENYCYNGSSLIALIKTPNDLYKCPELYYRLEAKRNSSKDPSMKCSDTLFSCTSFSNNSFEKHCVKKMFLDSSTFCQTSETLRVLSCYENEFKCPKSGKCLPRKRIRNGIVECTTPEVTDESDEESFLLCDPQTEFQCKDKSRRCIPREWVQDGFPHCENGSDESVTLQCNQKTEFRCSGNGRCVLRNRVNDGIVDCLNATDENVQNFTCFRDTEFDCGENDRCIPRMWIGNSIYECKSKSDEEEMILKCQKDEFGCMDKSRCLPRQFLCDGNQNCADGSDETSLCDHPRLFTCTNDSSIHIPWSATFVTDVEVWSCPDRSHLDTKRLIGFKCQVEYQEFCEKKITKKRKLVPQFYLHNGISVCADKSDQCFDSEGNFKCVRCLEGTTIIAKAQVCDGFVDCPDVSDECSCELSDVEPLCNKLYPLGDRPSSTNASTAINMTLICDGKIDYADGIDEQFCDKDNSENNNTIPRHKQDHQCYSTDIQHSETTIVARDSVCNGLSECPVKDDECSMKCQHNSLGKISMKDLSGRFLETCFESSVRKSDEMRDCRSLHEFLLLTEKRRYYLANEFISKSKACFKSIDMACFNDPDLCPWRFKCNSTADKQTIERSKRCDLNSDCDDMSDETGCSNNTHFYCLGGEPLFISSEKYKDGVVDCMDRSDEFLDNNFSSKFEMIRNVFLFKFIWFSSTVAMLTNLVVIFVHFKKLTKNRDKHKLAFTNTLMVINLALSDFLMGVALLIVGFKSYEFSGKYSSYDLSWRSSTLCNAVQILTMISSETSVSMLTLITALRLHTVLKPFKSNRINYKLWCIAVFVAWLWSAFVAFYPNLKGSFVREYFVGRSPFFLDQKVDKHTLERYSLRTKLMMDSNNRSSNISSFPSRKIEIKGRFGYYSSSSVCFPDLYANTLPEFRLSFVVILYNSIALLFIAVSYVMIFKHAITDKKLSAPSQDQAVTSINSKMKTRMMIVVLTDALCWMPILTMAFVSYAGYKLPDIVHPISAIVLMPINSVINPIIYSRFDQILIRLWKRIKHHRHASFESNRSGQETSATM